MQAVKQMTESARLQRNAEEQQIETDDFVEDLYDYDNVADNISSEESDSDCEGTVYPERDTVNIYVEEKFKLDEYSPAYLDVFGWNPSIDFF
ncbi:hypothetical protein DPMN_161811 [Dreissena polymorpha]|uniref:Uncharacterized protein n=1 Tax=Dreissena polymorpha TaxID=45954 RepID=A0A9D4IPZ8_DREPO|nr:hypothetical protein DPMN_161811 [Dreissena polymorpha]